MSAFKQGRDEDVVVLANNFLTEAGEVVKSPTRGGFLRTLAGSALAPIVAPGAVATAVAGQVAQHVAKKVLAGPDVEWKQKYGAHRKSTDANVVDYAIGDVLGSHGFNVKVHHGFDHINDIPHSHHTGTNALKIEGDETTHHFHHNGEHHCIQSDIEGGYGVQYEGMPTWRHGHGPTPEAAYDNAQHAQHEGETVGSFLKHMKSQGLVSKSPWPTPPWMRSSDDDF